MSDIGRKIGENIRLVRKSKGLSQEQLALRAEINASYMGQVERGEKNPTIDVLGKIASALQTPLEQLVHVGGTTRFEGGESGSYSDKIVSQMTGLNLKEQEAVYRFVKQLVQFREME
ncbi:helix-turn-helix transcriptional regulator [Paenibacillus sp. LHD-117]|uniref:helix-turn-helix domain-containing protein n=1 Tax=Paenibacillus sp. LHD-117 TaxID=3071412 RepID=UPI0027DF18A3|nr:helix-turn-helix transcriptional regulator [Paenibacillus sp. LHD-117]MDQ6422345.1 helix-turn-helix transcriptional regulator [Paenibacillus sp. LHD-117]